MAGKHVLIVDDDVDFVKLYSLFLRNKGLEVSASYSAAEALEALQQDEAGHRGARRHDGALRLRVQREQDDQGAASALSRSSS